MPQQEYMMTSFLRQRKCHHALLVLEVAHRIAAGLPDCWDPEITLICQQKSFKGKTNMLILTQTKNNENETVD